MVFCDQARPEGYFFALNFGFRLRKLMWMNFSESKNNSKKDDFVIDYEIEHVVILLQKINMCNNDMVL